MAVGKSTAADLRAWLCFEDEAGQTLRPPRGRTWGRRGHTPVVRVRAAGSGRISIAGLIATKPGHRPRLVYRTRLYRRSRKGEPKGFTETDYAALFDGAHQQLGGPLVVVWDNLGAHRSARMRQLVAARPWLRTYQLPAYAPELNPVEAVWSQLKRSLANLASRTLDQLDHLVHTRLRRMQYRPGLLNGYLAKTGLDFQPP